MQCPYCLKGIRSNVRCARIRTSEPRVVNLHWSCAKWALHEGEYPDAVAVYRLKYDVDIDLSKPPPGAAKAFATRMRNDAFKGTPRPASGMCHP